MIGFLFGILMGIVIVIIVVAIYIYLKRAKLLSLSYTFVNDRKCPVDISKKIFGCEYKDVMINPDNINFGNTQTISGMGNVQTISNLTNLSYFLCGLVGKLSYLKNIDNNSFGNTSYTFKSLLDITLLEKQTSDNTIFGKVFSLSKGGSPATENNIFIIFRGTHTLDEWKKDFNYYQNNLSVGNTIANKSQTVSQALYGGNPVSEALYGGNPVSEALYDASAPNILIHTGFLDIYNSIKDALYKTIEQALPKAKVNIIISGHSLGAGIATIANYDLKQRYGNLALGNGTVIGDIYSITFASPRVGNNDFRDSFNSICTHYSWINTSDIIPTLPLPVSPNFSDYKNPFIFTHVGKIIEFTSNWESLINNHMIPNYMEQVSLSGL